MRPRNDRLDRDVPDWTHELGSDALMDEDVLRVVQTIGAVIERVRELDELRD